MPRNPGIGDAGPVRPADRVDKRNAVIVQQFCDLIEIFLKMGQADMFEHADGNNTVKSAVNRAIILQAK